MVWIYFKLLLQEGKSVGGGKMGKVEEVLKEFCAWSGRDREEYIQQAVFERLKGDLEEVSALGILRAEKMLKKLLES